MLEPLIDLHAHLLPGIDDGPGDAEGALAMAAEAAASGVGVLAATPHLRHDFPAVRPEELASRVSALRAQLGAAGVALELVSGGEVDVAWAQHASDETLRAVSYGARGTDLLVETPYGELPPAFEELLFRIRVRGFRVLLAHPERNPTFQRDPARLARLVDDGTLVQVTAASLVSGRGSRTGAFGRSLVRDGLAHVIASDSHGGGGRASLAAAVAAMGEGRARWMATEAPAAILAGEPLPLPPAAARARRRGWRRR
jgi:protein-tyrosine phosphatase